MIFMACLVYGLEVFLKRHEDTNPTICTLSEGEFRVHWFYLSDQWVATESFYSFTHGSIPGYCGPRNTAPEVLTDILMNRHYDFDGYMTNWAIKHLRFEG